AAVPCDGLQVVSLGLREGVLRCRHRQEQIAKPAHTIEWRAELVRYVREELVLEFARLIELGVEAGQLPVLVLELGVLRLEALRGVAYLHRQAARMLVRGLALAGNGQVRRGVL